MGAMLLSRLPSLHSHRTWTPEADMAIDEPQPDLLSSPLLFWDERCRNYRNDRTRGLETMAGGCRE